MHLPQVKRELNINTIISVLGFLIVASGIVYSAGQFQAGVGELQRKYDTWIAQHENLHKERQSTIMADTARTETRLTAIELTLRKIENLEYRVTVQEQGAANLSRNVEELKTAVNNQSADLRVIREILTRLDPRTSDAVPMDR